MDYEEPIYGTIEEIIRCAICLDVPNNPKVLQCMHMFCLECLDLTHSIAVRNRYQSQEMVQCPVCRQETRIPDGGLVKLPTDYRTVQLAEAMKNLTLKRQSRMMAGTELDDNVIKSLAAQLHNCIEHRTWQKAKALLNDHSKPHRKKIVSILVAERSALFAAIEKNEVMLMAYLLEDCDADVEQLSKYIGGIPQVVSICQPLYLAVLTRNIEAANLLLKHGADVNGTSQKGSSAIMAACGVCHRQMVELLFLAGSDVNISNNRNMTSLMVAASKDSTGDLCKLLLDKGAAINAQNVNGYTALHFATGKQNFDIVQMLLDRGIDPSLQKKNGTTALHQAVKKEFVDITRLLCQSSSSGINIQDCNGLSPLLTAVINENKCLVELLLSYNADTDMVSKQNGYALLEAVVRNNTDILELLLCKGANPNLTVQNPDLPNVLLSAVFKDHTHHTKLLIDHGADVNYCSSDGIVPLHAAAWNGNVDFIRMLISKGTDLNHQTVTGDTALHAAISGNHLSVVRFLLSDEADPYIRNKKMEDAFLCAAQDKKYDILEVLVARHQEAFGRKK